MLPGASSALFGRTGCLLSGSLRPHLTHTFTRTNSTLRHHPLRCKISSVHRRPSVPKTQALSISTPGACCPLVDETASEHLHSVQSGGGVREWEMQQRLKLGDRIAILTSIDLGGIQLSSGAWRANSCIRKQLALYTTMKRGCFRVNKSSQSFLEKYMNWE